LKEKIQSHITLSTFTQQLLFWLFALIFVSGLEYSLNHNNLTDIFYRQLINILFYAILIYINTQFLVPTYFHDKKYPAYFILVIVTVIIITPIYTAVMYLRLGNDEYAKGQLLTLRNYYYLFNFFIIGSSTIYVIIIDWLSERKKRKELEQQQIYSELAFLKTQINPHFLFNTLNSIYALTLKKSDLAPKVVVQLSEMMRYMLYECNEKYVPLQSELNYINNYIELEKIRQSKNFFLEFNVTGKLENEFIAPLILISFIENSFKHGGTNQNNENFVKINVKIEDSKLLVDISNSLPPTNNRMKSEYGGIGIENTQKRLDLLYLDNHHLETRVSNGDYSIQLTILLLTI